MKLAKSNFMELNKSILGETITWDGQQYFCPEGNRLALEYLQAARDVLKKNDLTKKSTPEIYAAIPYFEKFHSHASQCKKCE